MKKYILWDFDCTLAYRDGKWTQTLFELLQKHKQNIPYEVVKLMMQRKLPWHEFEKSHQQLFKGKQWWEYVDQYIEDSLKQLGVKQAGNIAKEFKGHYLDLQYWHLYPNTIETLEKLSALGYTHVIASNHVPELNELCEQLGISQYFETIFNSAFMEYEKPNIKFYQEILRKLEVPSTKIMIGDNYNADIRGALRANIPAILLKEDNILNYRYYARSIEQVVEVIKNIEKNL